VGNMVDKARRSPPEPKLGAATAGSFTSKSKAASSRPTVRNKYLGRIMAINKKAK
jgi:hypothetical protein